MDIKTINGLIGVEESFQAPSKLKEILFDRKQREELFLKFLAINHDVSFDWFQEYFMLVQADRKKKKQDFTPNGISKIATRLVGFSKNYFEPTAGTGGMLIQQWDYECKKEGFTKYRPSHHFYEVEELSEAALPFLLFNCLIRGMNAVVIHGDSLSRKIKNIYFIQNSKDDSLSFSSLNMMPRTPAVEREFDVHEWIGEPIKHIEDTKYPRWLDVQAVE